MGFVRRICARGDPVEPRIADILVDDDWPQFLHPCSVSDKCFLIACRPDAKSERGIYLACPSWQRVFNVGFRVVCEDPQGEEPGGSNL